MVALISCCAPIVRAQLGNIPARTGRDCTVCHVEWIESFKQPDTVLLIDPAGKSVVSESDSCLDCHDGSIADSRRQVWVEHSHSVGVAPSAGMVVPKDFPLEEGKLACRTCHTAHANGFNESLKDAVFLRAHNEQDQLCKACHVDKAPGTKLGSHEL